MLELARTAVRHLHTQGCQWAQLTWNTDLAPDSTEQSYPAGATDPRFVSLLTRIRHQGGLIEQVSHDGMATDFLTQIGALASAALSRLLPR